MLLKEAAAATRVAVVPVAETGAGVAAAIVAALASTVTVTGIGVGVALMAATAVAVAAATAARVALAVALVSKVKRIGYARLELQSQASLTPAHSSVDSGLAFQHSLPRLSCARWSNFVTSRSMVAIR